ncbi:conserved hypothetical protein [Streptomyces sviceus ATCC 29083]|uniref:Secreted protein n=1 Tax=Streptomyces sviceus (strain ATCC 29083 / DSM 924 / JCM 4929 / NBRC 13980 / NCIMB 11184 / NRRL 5439 / UC 5370) TaxID=463191 RepID=B5HND5_STRX2|nr:conserved hypothetical protein [Streptomyces sviceus ATCC 29083]
MNARIRSVAVVASAALIPLFGATSAHAVDTSCPSNGYITNWDVCTKLSNGTLYLHETSKGTYVDVEYGKASGSSVSCKLGYLRSGTNHWSPTVTCSTSYQQNYQWSPSATCNPDVGLLYSGGTTFQTPPTKNC